MAPSPIQSKKLYNRKSSGVGGWQQQEVGGGQNLKKKKGGGAGSIGGLHKIGGGLGPLYQV